LADFQKIFIDGKSLAPTVDDNSERKLSKKEPAKHARLLERQKAAASAAAAVSAFALEGDEDPLRTNYGDITLKELASSKPISGKKKRTLVQDLNDGLKGNMVVVRGRVQAIRAVGKKMVFLVVRRRGCTVQCVLTVSQDLVSSQMVKFATSLSRESIIEIEGLVSYRLNQLPAPLSRKKQKEKKKTRMKKKKTHGHHLLPQPKILPSASPPPHHHDRTTCLPTPKRNYALCLMDFSRFLLNQDFWSRPYSSHLFVGGGFGGGIIRVEIQLRKLYCVDRAVPTLPFNFDDAARSEADIEKALQAGEQLVRVNQGTRLNYRFLDIPLISEFSAFSIKFRNNRIYLVPTIFCHFLESEDFFGIHTPKTLAGSSEGGSAVFRLDYKGTSACLAQSPQLHKQLSIVGDFDRVFEIGPVFRAEDSFTHRHLCEFTGLDVEMEIDEHYSEVMDIVDRLFVTMFDFLNEECSELLEAINRQYPFKPLKVVRLCINLMKYFLKGSSFLQEASVEVDPLGDLSTETDRKLGQHILEKYDTEFYILYRYPLSVRPFYTMPSHDGEETISGGQRVHVADLLRERAQACGIDVTSKTISTYIDSFRYGTAPHGGFGVGLERVVMLFCAPNNIRKTSLFPRDPQRIVP
ncbi:hypothetical protein MIMGU_mgv1a019826mg, partial [Erythranthe guttata]